MEWQYSRVDHLQPGACCLFCSRPLKSLKGIVISDGTREAYAGPNCAKKHLGAPEERLLDVARLAMLVVSDGDPLDEPPPVPAGDPVPQSGPEAIGRKASVARAPLPPLDSVVQYLRLRYEVMNGFKFQRSALLTEAYSSLQSGDLDETLRKRVAGTMRSAQANRTVFSERNVKICIGLNYWLHEALNNTPKERASFLEAMASTLHSRWNLSRGQLEAINKWGANLRRRVHGFPHLDVGIFDGVITPDFMRQKTKRDSKPGDGA